MFGKPREEKKAEALAPYYGVPDVDFSKVEIDPASFDLLPKGAYDPRYVAIARVMKTAPDAKQPSTIPDGLLYSPRFAVVGWLFENTIYLVFKLSLGFSFEENELAALKAKNLQSWEYLTRLKSTILEEFGAENVVISKDKHRGRVHEAIVSALEEEDKDLAGRKKIGLSFEKFGNRIVWLNRSMQNFRTFTRNPLGNFCNLFVGYRSTASAVKWDMDYHLDRSIPMAQFTKLTMSAQGFLLGENTPRVVLLSPFSPTEIESLLQNPQDTYIITDDKLYFFEAARKEVHEFFPDKKDEDEQKKMDEAFQKFKQKLGLAPMAKNERRREVVGLTLEQHRTLFTTVCMGDCYNAQVEAEWDGIRRADPTEMQRSIRQAFMNTLYHIMKGHGAKRDLNGKHPDDPTSLHPEKTLYEKVVQQAFKDARTQGITIDVDQIVQNDDDAWNDAPVLFLAVRKEKTEMMKILIQAGASLTAVDNHECTVVEVAAKEGKLKALKVLLEYKLDAENIEKAFAAAITGQQFAVAKLLAEKRDDLSDWELLAAVTRRDAAAINEYLRHQYPGLGADQQKDDLLRLAFTEALKNKDLQVIAALTNSPLYHYRRLNLVSALTVPGINELERKHNNLAFARQHLLEAALRGAEKFYDRAVRVLQEADDPKILLNAQDEHGRTPLFVACDNGHDNIVKLFLEYKANAAICNHAGRSPLHVAARNEHKNCVKLLLEHDADLKNKLLNLSDEKAIPAELMQDDVDARKFLYDVVKEMQAAAAAKKSTGRRKSGEFFDKRSSQAAPEALQSQESNPAVTSKKDKNF